MAGKIVGIGATRETVTWVLTAYIVARVTSEVTEMLAVLVVPAMLLSGFNLFFG